MRPSQFLSGKATRKTLLASGLVLLAAAFPACDNKSGTDASSAVTAASSGTVSGAIAQKSTTKGWKYSRPTNHQFTIQKSSRRGSGATDSATDGATSLRAAFVQAVQSEGGAEYAARPTEKLGSPAFRFDNRSSKLSAEIDQEEVRVDVNNGDARGSVGFRLSSVGCKGNVGGRFASARPQHKDGRVLYARPGVTEWYKNGPLGVEQGFDLAAAPDCRKSSRDEAIELKLQVGHRLQPTLQNGKDGAQWLELRDDAGRTVLRYSDLYAEDKNHKVLPSTMSFDSNKSELTLRIDDRNAAYPVSVDPLIWAQLGNRYKAATGDIQLDDGFGYSVAVSGDHAIIGAPGDDEACGGSNCDAGAAYIFMLSSQGTWTQQVKMQGLPLASATDPGGQWGYAVAIDDVGGGEKRVVIGAPRDPGTSSGMSPTEEQGLVTWFRGRGTTWNTEGQFNGAGRYGAAVGVSGKRIIVGGPSSNSGDGAAVIYEPDVTLSPPWGEVGNIFDVANIGNLGSSVAIDGDVAVVGSPTCCDTTMPGPKTQGAAFVYEFYPGGMAGPPDWIKTADLLASDGSANAAFGISAAIHGLSMIIGSNGFGGAAGAAYIFISSRGVWQEEAALHTLTGVTLAADDNFGASVALASNIAVVGAYGTDVNGNADAGAAYVFERNAGNWSLKMPILVAANPAPPHVIMPTADESFGRSVAIDRNRASILIGSDFEDTTAQDSGAFWHFIQRKDIGDVCANNVECATDFCVDGFCCENACGGNTDNDCQACSAAKKVSGANGLCGIAATSNKCHSALGGCDSDVFCDGTNNFCANGTKANMAPCRPATGLCDVAELCDGSSVACPADAVLGTGTVCRGVAAGDAGGCDVPELCNGQDKGCPADQFKPGFTICRLPLGGECDQFEVCTGLTAACPADTNAADATPCSQGSCQAGICRAEADLGIALSGPPSVSPQTDLSYTLTVTNFGRSSANNISVDVTLSNGATLVGSSGQPVACVSKDGGATCMLSTLNPQQSTNITLLVHPGGQAETMKITATVTSPTPDPNLVNNVATLDQNLLSPRISGGGAGCSAIPGGAASGLSSGLSLLGLLALVARRRRRSS